MAKHRHEAAGSRHPGVSWDYDDAAERTGASGFDTYDLGGFAWQKDNDSIWVLTAITPTWVSVSGGTSDPDAIHDNVDGEINAITTKSSVVAGDVFLIEDSVASFSKKKVAPGAISHTLLGDIGSNSHASIDTHLGNTSNPHSVTKSQVGLGNVPDLDTTDAVSNEHTHSNKAQIDLVTDGDHDVRTDNPHGVTAAQAGAVDGPGSSTDNAIPRFDGTGGHLLQNSGVIVDDSDNIEDIRTATFKSVPTVTPFGGTLTCAFDDYQKIIGNLNNVATVTIRLNTPNGPGNYMLVLLQGGTSPSTSITWSTEGFHALWGNITIPSGAGERAIVGLFYDGATWYGEGRQVSQILSS